MNMLKAEGPVVVEVTGGPAGLPAVEFACAEAIRAGAALVLAVPYAIAATSTAVATGADVPQLVSTPRLFEAVELARLLGGGELPVTVVTGEGPRSKILPAVASGARLLVLPGGDGRPAHRLLTAQAELTLAVLVGVPTVSVPASWEPSGARGVAVGVDGTELSVEALDFAFRAAAARAVPLYVVHAAHRAGTEQPAQRAERVLSETLAGRSDEYPEVDVHRVVTTTSATAALIAESRTAELLVVGARSVALAVVNPVVRRVVAASRCPVAVVPHTVSAADRERVRRQTSDAGATVQVLY